MNFERCQDSDAASAVSDTRRIETLKRSSADEAMARNIVDALHHKFDSLLIAFAEGGVVDPASLDLLGSQIAGAVSSAQDIRADDAKLRAA